MELNIWEIPVGETQDGFEIYKAYRSLKISKVTLFRKTEKTIKVIKDTKNYFDFIENIKKANRPNTIIFTNMKEALEARIERALSIETRLQDELKHFQKLQGEYELTLHNYNQYKGDK